MIKLEIMKTLSMIFLLLIIPIIVIGQNLKALDDKNGFREAKFGMSPSSFRKLEQLKQLPLYGLGVKEENIDRTKMYLVPGEYYDKDVDLHIGNFSLEYVKYYFYKNRLVTIKIRVSKGLTNQNGVLEVLKSAYGMGVLKKAYYISGHEDTSYSYYIWEGEKVKMSYTLDCDHLFESREITIINKELMNWVEVDRPIEEEQQRKQAIQDAAKKL